MKNAIIYLGLVIVLAISISINVFLFRELKVLRTPVQVEEIEVTDNAESLADAITLLPNPENAIGGRKISDGIYWVWVRVPNPKGGLTSPIEQSWIVNLNNQIANNISERNFGPVGGNVWVDVFSDEYLEVDWSGGWEGFSLNAKEFFDRQTGELLYTLIVNSGQNAELLAGDKDWKIDFEPLDLCDSVVSETNLNGKDLATGLNIDGTVYSFPKSLEVTCNFSEMSGQKLHDHFSFVLSEDEQVVRLILPGSAHVEIPIPSLNLEEISFDNFPE